MLEKPTLFSQHGCADQSNPTIHSEETLSRVFDMLYAAEQAGLDKTQVNKIFSILPETMKLEFNYSNWKYREPCEVWSLLSRNTLKKTIGNQE